jgi:cysteinyl-tRNA synthetase
VHNDAHIGHGKTYVNFDTVVRYLRYLGYDVLHVENITDVGHLLDTGEDRILKGAKRERVNPWVLAEMYTRRFFRDMDALNVLRPDITPRASGHIPEQIELVKTLLEKGFAYEVNGSVYFAVRKFPGYGKLSGRKLDDLMEGTRIEVLEEKRDPADFALWKRAEPEHVMQWPSPWGQGYPGWHVECSAMSAKYLGQPFDIHGGGMDNKFPHHECEIAQSEAATGKPFARYWLHNGMLMIRGEEMHRSLGNFLTLEQVLQQHSPMAVRFFILSSHYRSPIDVTEEALVAAGKGVERLYNTMRHVRARLSDSPSGPVEPDVEAVLSDAESQFREAMDDDLNTASGLAVLFDLNREVNRLLRADEELSRDAWEQVDRLYGRLAGDVLGLVTAETFQAQTVGLTEDLLSLLVDTRTALRQAKQWALADEIRDRLESLGVVLEDTPDGTSWRVSPPAAADE